MGSRPSLSKLSFHWQITLLGALMAVLFVAVLFAALAASRYTRSAVLSGESRSLSQTAYVLAREYTNRMPPGQQDSAADPLEDPSSQASKQALTLISRVVLQNVDGVEGGFYSSEEDSLVGYSFPTRGGIPDDSKENTVPLAEQAAILGVARTVALTRQPGGQILAGLPDVVLIQAVPINSAQRSIGSAWVLQRLSTVPGTNRFRTYLIAVGLGLAALGCVLLTFFVVRNLQHGVRKIESGLQDLEGDLGSQIPTGTDPEEIDRIALAINQMAATLRENIARERQFEDQLRHAERLAALGRLVAGVAHEVRNPLATVRLRIQMCQRHTADPHVHQSCVVALEEIERLNGIVNRLLTFSQPIELNRGPTNICRLAEARLELFRPFAEKNRVRFITSFSQDATLLLVDQARMAQVFDNIIQNAIESIPSSGGTIWVEVSSETESGTSEAALCIEFRDSGKGIHPAIAGRIFDPFFTTKASGTGLGLSICHELVRAHGGDIQVESNEGAGTTVRILLPVPLGNRTLLHSGTTLL